MCLRAAFRALAQLKLLCQGFQHKGLKSERILLLPQVIAGSCQPPLVDEELLHYANEMFDDTCYVLPK